MRLARPYPARSNEMPAPVLPTAVPSLLAVANQERARSFSWSLAVRAVWRNTTTLMTPMAAPSHQHAIAKAAALTTVVRIRHEASRTTDRTLTI